MNAILCKKLHCKVRYTEIINFKSFSYLLLRLLFCGHHIKTFSLWYKLSCLFNPAKFKIPRLLSTYIINFIKSSFFSRASLLTNARVASSSLSSSMSGEGFAKSGKKDPGICKPQLFLTIPSNNTVSVVTWSNSQGKTGN